MPDFTDKGDLDFMAKSTSLRRKGMQREFFDPANPAHLASLASFLKTGHWIQQFFPEDPFNDVPTTVFRKYIGHNLGVDVTNAQKATKRQPLVPPSPPSNVVVIKRENGDERSQI